MTKRAYPTLRRPLLCCILYALTSYISILVFITTISLTFMLVLRQHSNLSTIRLALNLLIAVYDYYLPSRTRPRALSFIYPQNL